MKHTNSLIHAKSPYLLQHAHNPVNWEIWGDEAFARAKKEDKLVLVSIGYSSCHWCHVMEHESFEDEATAAIMNEHFITIKVDREERPDVDHIYMTAVQLMSGHGGWPLNCFVLPDGRPVYGGTYFPKQKWNEILRNLAGLYKQSRNKVEEYAAELTKGIKQVSEFTELVEEDTPVISKEEMTEALARWSKKFDKKEGGNQGAPKFPMPTNYLFLLRYGCLNGRDDLVEHVHTTLQKMALGGIYDQLGGGFARYSTDPLWKVPHFEKMLYDNAQLVTLYSEAYRQNKDPLYKQVIYETVAFLEREMTSPHGGSYSALDADSEGKEGLFYIWTKEELQEILKKDFAVFSDYYSVNEMGYWEDEAYILLREMPEKAILKKHAMSKDALDRVIRESKEKLMERRDQRIRPGLDDKIIASWNGLMIRGLFEAYASFGDKKFLDRAHKNLQFVMKTMVKADGSLFRCAKGSEGYGNAFLDDYAFIIDAFIASFCSTGNEKDLSEALRLTEHCFSDFYSEEQGLFYFSPKRGENLVSANFDVSDNVIPSSNSQMALNLQHLYSLTGTGSYKETADRMLRRMQAETSRALYSNTNWAIAALRADLPFFEVCIVGKDVDEFRSAFAGHYHPNAIFVYSKTASGAALLKNRHAPGETRVYVCRNNACDAPVLSVPEALELLK